MACFISCGTSEHKSEDMMFAYLRDNLPEDWVVLGNVALVERSRDLEFDSVIIGGGIIWVVEGKCWHGDITGDQYTWFQNGGKGRKSPLRSIGEKARKLGSTVKDCGINSFVTSLVVMLANKGKYSLTIDNDPSVEACVYHLNDVPSKLIEQSKPVGLSSTQIVTLVKRLGGTRAEEKYNKYLATVKISPPVTSPVFKEREDETVYVVTLRGQDNFTRTYYSCDFTRILLGREELRGAYPPVWKNWREDGACVRFSKNGVGFEAVTGTKVVLNGSRELPDNKTVKPSGSNGQINIGGIELDFEIESILFS